MSRCPPLPSPPHPPQALQGKVEGDEGGKCSWGKRINKGKPEASKKMKEKVTSDKVGRNVAIEIRKRFMVKKKKGGGGSKRRSVPIFPTPRTNFLKRGGGEEKKKASGGKCEPPCLGMGCRAGLALGFIYFAFIFFSSNLLLCCRFPSLVETQRWRPASFPQTSSFQKIFKNI